MMTPFCQDERIDYNAWQSLIDTLIAAGVDGLFCGGSSGEFFALHTRRAEVTLRFCRQAVNGRVPLYGNVGCITTRDTVALARVAEAEGIDIIVVVTPYYLRASQHELADHYIEVCRAVRVPVLAYNFPPHGATGLAPDTLSLIADALPKPRPASRTPAAISTSESPTATAPPAAHMPVLVGPENLIVTALDNGLAGTVTALANIAPRLYVDLYRAYREGRRADADRLQSPRHRYVRLGPRPHLPQHAQRSHGA